MRAVLGIGIAVGGVVLLAYLVYGVRLSVSGSTSSESTAAQGGTPNNPTGQQYREHKGLPTSTGGTQS